MRDISNLQEECQPVRVGRIYFIRCLITNMYHVGQTIKKLEIRISQHKHNKKSRIGKAIHEYGWDNFTYGILKDNIPENLLDECEKFYIARYDCVYPKGYNGTDGGRNPPSHRGKPKSESHKKKISAAKLGKKRGSMSEAQKAKLHEINSGEKHPQYGKPKSEETRKKISATLSGRKNPEHSARMKGRTSPNKGKTLSEATKKKISESKRRKNLIKKMIEILNKTIDRSAEFHQE